MKVAEHIEASKRIYPNKHMSQVKVEFFFFKPNHSLTLTYKQVHWVPKHKDKKCNHAVDTTQSYYTARSDISVENKWNTLSLNISLILSVSSDTFVT